MTQKDNYRMQREWIKSLRRDARKLSTVAKHLRSMADTEARSIRAMERADRAKGNFYSKKAAIDNTLSLIPELGANND